MSNELSPRRLAQVFPTDTAETAIYTVPGGEIKTIIKQVIIANVTVNQARANLSVVPSGAVADNSNRLIKDVDIAANAVMIFDLSQVMHPGDFLSIKASTGSALVFTISGVEYVAVAGGVGGGGGPHLHPLTDLPDELATEDEVASIAAAIVAGYSPLSHTHPVTGGETDPLVFMGGL
jgi:hypothetical protein